MTRHEFRELASPDTAREILAELDVDTDIEEVSLGQASGRRLATRIDADIDVPGFDRAAMDGYAVRAADTFGASEAKPTRLAVVDSMAAGESPTIEIDREAAVQVATGATLPPGTNAVVPVERTTSLDGEVAIATPVAPGDHVQYRGADIAAGDRALSPGTRLGARHVALLSAIGREFVPVRGRPRVAVLSTGGELVDPGEPLDPAAGEIYDVNGVAISAAIEAAGGVPKRLHTAPDDPAELRETLSAAAASADLLVTSGSTSAGSVDVLPDVIEEHGELLLHGVAMKPGRPLLVGRAFDTPLVGLPGYPVSAMAVFRTFVAPIIRKTAHVDEPDRATVSARLGSRIRYDGGRMRLVPVGLVEDGNGSDVAYPLSRGSGATTSLAETDGVVRMSPGTNTLSRGRDVTVERFDASAPIPSPLVVGDPDPLLSGLLDDVEEPRFLRVPVRDIDRWVENGVPDVVVAPRGLSGVSTVAPDPEDTASWETLARFTREWGLVGEASTMEGGRSGVDILDSVEHLASLAGSLGLRHAFDDWVAATMQDGNDAITQDGLPGLESAARAVHEGRTRVGLALSTTADRLSLDYLPLGSQELVVAVDSARREKPGVRDFESILADRLGRRLADLPGYAEVESEEP
ncbi:molybdopterin biosynthesis protein MoeA/LysR substrate binding-domain-containing protein [Halovivax asiaticus JCM 14624]|uniref:Molybdopterin biosynthesis protein MoeA/LysR substrate binding-domain-containing protein n=1 Tax=Halovivax asiaticus JCM 14624 TaxID=1227490 RepID=M0BT18_9EURY|nr:molybdopterin biosynthesis protein [Halovivax asiaticus]ELZ13513.1 molybdopterin biosynthesis protein MoeA/LysR substrate binding-domain-containing protein [Halovivax asiaticus JCM 14624]